MENHANNENLNTPHPSADSTATKTNLNKTDSKGKPGSVGEQNSARSSSKNASNAAEPSANDKTLEEKVAEQGKHEGLIAEEISRLEAEKNNLQDNLDQKDEELTKCQNIIKQLEDEKQSLKNQIDKLEKETRSNKETEINGTVDREPSKTKYILEAWTAGADYRVTITICGTDKKKSFKRFNKNEIIDFIEKNLPKALENGLSETDSKKISAPTEISDGECRNEIAESHILEYPNHPIRTIELSQENFIVQKNCIDPEEPLSITVTCALPASIPVQTLKGQSVFCRYQITELGGMTKVDEKDIKQEISMGEGKCILEFTVGPFNKYSYYQLEINLNIPKAQLSDRKSIIIIAMKYHDPDAKSKQKCIDAHQHKEAP